MKIIIKIIYFTIYLLRYFFGYLLILFLYDIGWNMITETVLDMSIFIAILSTFSSLIKTSFCFLYKIENTDTKIIKNIINM